MVWDGDPLVRLGAVRAYLHAGQGSAAPAFLDDPSEAVRLAAIEAAGRLHLLEIKSSATITPKHADSLVQARRDLGESVASNGYLARTCCIAGLEEIECDCAAASGGPVGPMGRR